MELMDEIGASPEVKSGDFEWTGPESNWRHTAFQAVALPTELPVQVFPKLASDSESNFDEKLRIPTLSVGIRIYITLSKANLDTRLFPAKQQRDPNDFYRKRLSELSVR